MGPLDGLLQWLAGSLARVFEESTGFMAVKCVIHKIATFEVVMNFIILSFRKSDLERIFLSEEMYASTLSLLTFDHLYLLDYIRSTGYRIL